MKYTMKMGAVSLTLAALISGCAPTPGATPQAGATGGYDSYGTGGAATGTNYGYGTGTTGTAGTAPAATNTNTSYSSYGAGTAAGGSTGGGSTGGGYGTTTGSSTSYYDYSAPGGSSSSSGGYSNNSAGGSYAVQVVASPNQGTAEAMRSQMQSQGFNAVVDQVGGLYKVRIPYRSESEAKSNLGRIRSSGASDAFYTTR